MSPSASPIRWATPDDVPELIRLCAEHAVFERATYDPAGKADALTRHLFGPDPRARCLVVDGEPGSPLLGYATFTREFSTWDADFFIHVDCLFLRPAARNRQLGWQLGKRIASEALALGVGFMQFQTPPFNETAIRLYQAMGAQRKEKVRFYADRNDLQRFVGHRAIPIPPRQRAAVPQTTIA